MQRHEVTVSFRSAALDPPVQAELLRATAYLEGRLRSRGQRHELTLSIVAASEEDARAYAAQVISRFAEEAAIADLRID